MEQLLSSYLYSCQQIPPSQLLYPPPALYTPPGLIPYTPPTHHTPTFPSPPSYTPPTQFHQLPPTILTTPPPLYFSSTPSPPSDQSTDPVPSVVIHHKPSSYPPPPPETWRDQTEYRTKLMDSAISKTELLDLLAYYPLHPPSSGKIRRSTSSSSSSTSEKPYTRPRSSPITNSRTSFTSTQLESLEDRFRQSQSIDRDERLNLSLKIGVSETAIRTWFQNRRARQRRTEALKKQAEQAAETGTVDEVNIPAL
ncbi:hypothetical protein ACHWQZ_G008579 [Mnemiopsis leidyi]